MALRVHPHPQPHNSLLRILRPQPGLEWKSLTMENLVGAKSAPTAVSRTLYVNIGTACRYVLTCVAELVLCIPFLRGAEFLRVLDLHLRVSEDFSRASTRKICPK